VINLNVDPNTEIPQAIQISLPATEGMLRLDEALRSV